MLVVERVAEALCVGPTGGKARESRHVIHPALPVPRQFPLTGCYKFLKGAMGYRFFLQDAVSFRKSLRVRVGFRANEAPMFRREFSKPGNSMQLSRRGRLDR